MSPAPARKNCWKIIAISCAAAKSRSGKQAIVTRYTRRLRQLNRTPEANYLTFKKGIEHADPAISANVITGLIKVTCYLLDQQLRRLERDFLNEGGLRERMTRARLARRKSQKGPR
jgi:four helix bundle suffix protein